MDSQSDIEVTKETFFRREICKSASTRNIFVDITMDDVFELTKKPCHYCGCSPFRIYPSAGARLARVVHDNPIIINGIDRKDPKQGYTKDNCVPACYDCNMSKQDMQEQEYIERSARIAKYHNAV